MVAFHDRRRKQYESIEDLTPGLHLGPGDTLSKSVIAGRYVVRGRRTEEGRRYTLHEALPNGDIIQRGEFDSRRLARKQTSVIQPTRTYDTLPELQ